MAAAAAAAAAMDVNKMERAVKSAICFGFLAEGVRE